MTAAPLKMPGKGTSGGKGAFLNRLEQRTASKDASSDGGAGGPDDAARESVYGEASAPRAVGLQTRPPRADGATRVRKTGRAGR